MVSSSSSRPRQLAGSLAKVVPAVISVGLLLVAWEFYAAYSGIKPTILPAPSRVFEQAVLNRDALIDNAIPTIRATLIGFACSLGAAFLLSMLVDFFEPLRRALFPVFIVSQTLPLVAIAPLVVLWLGFGLTPKIMWVAVVTFFPMLVALQGYEATEAEIGQMLRASRALARLHATRRLGAAHFAD